MGDFKPCESWCCSIDAPHRNARCSPPSLRYGPPAKTKRRPGGAGAPVIFIAKGAPHENGRCRIPKYQCTENIVMTLKALHKKLKNESYWIDKKQYVGFSAAPI